MKLKLKCDIEISQTLETMQDIQDFNDDIHVKLLFSIKAYQMMKSQFQWQIFFFITDSSKTPVCVLVGIFYPV